MLRVFLFCMVISACDARVDRVHVIDHAQRPSAELQRRDGVKDGPVTLYWPNGTARLQGQYRADRREGWWRGFHPQGGHRSITRYAGGLKDGIRIFWDTLGRAQRAEVFVAGVPDGPFYRFFPDGSLAQHSNYVNGLLEGPHDQWYTERGGTRVNGFYHLGKEAGVWTEYDTRGRMIWQAYMKGGEVVRAMHGTRRRH